MPGACVCQAAGPVCLSFVILSELYNPFMPQCEHPCSARTAVSGAGTTRGAQHNQGSPWGSPCVQPHLKTYGHILGRAFWRGGYSNDCIIAPKQYDIGNPASLRCLACGRPKVSSAHRAHASEAQSLSVLRPPSIHMPPHLCKLAANVG